MFEDVPAFVAVVETGGFAAASRHLNLSRSAVGKAVARLEDRLGVRLLQRTTRRQSLTDDGQIFYERCQRALDEMKAATAQLESGRMTAGGKLRASMPVLYGRIRIVPILARLTDTHPDLAIELNLNDRHVDLVEDGFDLVIRNGPLQGGTSLRSRRLDRQQERLYAAPSYLERHGVPATLDDLPAHRAVVYARSGRLHAWRFPGGTGAVREVTPPARLRFDDLGAVADAAIAGFGIAWLPDWLAADAVRSGALQRIVPDAPSLETGIHAVWPQTPHLPTRVRVTIDALVTGLSSRRSPAGKEDRDVAVSRCVPAGRSRPCRPGF